MIHDLTPKTVGGRTFNNYESASLFFACLYDDSDVITFESGEEDPGSGEISSLNNGFVSDSFAELTQEIENRGLTYPLNS
jgi:hypothetical protein